MTDAEFLILGGGPAGIGAAIFLQDAGRAFHLLEAQPGFGGLSSSFVDEHGFTWDLGGHVLFSHYDSFDRYMDLALGQNGWLTHERESWIWIRNRWVPYPFQNNLHRLPPLDRWDCVRGLLAAWLRHQDERRQTPPAHFRAWINQTFGAGIAELFMIPYNRKVWAVPPETMDRHWVGERVCVPSPETVLRGMCTGEDQVSWGPNATFRFPRQGGTGAIWTALGHRLPQENVSMSDPCVHIDPASRVAESATGKRWRWQHLISTMPLHHLIRIVPGVVPMEQADKLVYSGTHLIGIGLDGTPPDLLRKKCWMYFPEANSPYYRVTVFSNYSPNNVPRTGEQWSLMAEVSESKGKPVDAERIADRTVRALNEDGLIPDPSAVVSLVHRHVPQGYPTPFLGRDDVVDPVLRAFERAGIFSRGRFGAWKYEIGNQDHCFAQGRECATRLLHDGDHRDEPTLFNSQWVNGRRNP
jgi:protoporphyrinogen oxidase